MKFIRFLAVGLPAFIIAVPLNYLLVDKLQWNLSVSYAIILVLQVIVNFFMCRYLVFENQKHTKIYLQFTQFVTGILFFRLADWSLYILLVEYVGLYYLGVQLFNIFIFALLKFKLSKKIMEPKKGN